MSTESTPNTPAMDFESSPTSFMVELERFEGPLDLLLHLIKQHEMDIFDIPVAEILAKYLEYMAVIQKLNLDLAGDFLVMAATLAHIKSKMLLPPSDDPEDEADDDLMDPREELVRRLLEYQKYKTAAEQLDSKPLLNRDVYVRSPERPKSDNAEAQDIEDVSVFELISIFQELLDKIKLHAPHKVQLDNYKVEDKIRDVLSKLRAAKRVDFRHLFKDIYTRPELVTTFLAILELARMRVVRLFQTSVQGEIYLSMRPDAPDDKSIMERVTLEEEPVQDAPAITEADSGETT